MARWPVVVATVLALPLMGATREAQLHLMPTESVKPVPPTTRPTTRPANSLAPHAAKGLELPAKFSLLLSRSVFARNGKSAGAIAGPPIPEAGMALRGIVFDDTSFVAFIEDTMAHRTLQLRPGDSLCAGSVRQISLDGLSYECHGKTTHVEIGQNLLGAALPVPAPPPAATPGPPPPGTAGPPPPGAGPPGKGPIYGIGPNGQRIREYSEERAKAPQ